MQRLTVPRPHCGRWSIYLAHYPLCLPSATLTVAPDERIVTADTESGITLSAAPGSVEPQAFPTMVLIHI